MLLNLSSAMFCGTFLLKRVCAHAFISLLREIPVTALNFLRFRFEVSRNAALVEVVELSGFRRAVCPP